MVIDHSVREREAPSNFAASYTEVGMCCRPARKNSEMYPTDDHTCTNATDGNANCGSVSHSTRRPSSAFIAPVLGSRIHFHTTPRASGAHTHGSTYSTRSAPVPGSLRLIANARSSPRRIEVGMDISTNAAVTSSELPKAAEVKMCR